MTEVPGNSLLLIESWIVPMPQIVDRAGLVQSSHELARLAGLCLAVVEPTDRARHVHHLNPFAQGM